MKIYPKYIAIGSGATALVMAALLAFAGVANANPQFYAKTAQTGVATTTWTHMEAATATTTVVIYDAYNQTATPYVTTKPIDAALAVQLGATSTSPVFNLAVQYALDVPNFDCVATPLACDWYDSNLLIPTSQRSGTDITIADMFAVRTLAAGTSTKLIYIPTPTRYTRVVTKLTGGPGNVWGQLVPAKESTK